MSLITSIGREPGYPNCVQELKGKRIVLSYQDRYKVLVTDEHALGEDILTAAATTLKVGDTLGSFAHLTRVALNRDKSNRLLYMLDASYTTEEGADQNVKDASKSPDQRKAEWAWDFETVSFVMMKDVDTQAAVANSANEPFEAIREIAIPILTIERWEAFFDPSTIINYVNHRNKSTFWTAAAEAVVCTGIRDRKDTTEVYNGFFFRKVTYTFKFMVPFIADVMEGAKLIVADIGTRYKLTAGATSYTTYRATDGMPTRAALNTDGTLRNAASALLFKKFNVFPKADFDALKINNTQI